MLHCKHIAPLVLALVVALATPALGGVAIFEENFDGYGPGVYPSPPWAYMFDGVSGLVSDAQAFNPPHSFRSESSSNWARWDYVTLTIPDLVSYHACIYLTAADRGGAVGFGFVEPGTSNTGWWANAVYFGNDGNIYFNTRTVGSVVLGTWMTDRWYEFNVIIDYTAMIADVYVDGGLAGNNIPTDPKTLPASVYGTPVPLDQFGMFGQNFSGAGSSVIYYDDLSVTDETAVPVQQSTWGAIKAMYEQE